jgi:signal transduction histidine kinase/ActR/RegA family two-component response regulator
MKLWRPRSPALAAALQMLVVGGTAMVGIAVLSISIQRILLDDLRHSLGQIAQSTAALIDTRQHERFVAERHAKPDEYAAANQPLRTLITSNPDIRYAYTAIIDRGTMRYVLDGDPVHPTSVLEPDPDPPLPGENEVWRSRKLTVEEAPSATSWGVGIRAYAPICNQDGRMVAYVGVTMRAERYMASVRNIRRAVLLGAAVSMLLALVSGAVIWRAQRERNRALDQALAASRAKSQFLANMSHEIRTPMNAVIGMLDVLLKSNLGTEQNRFAATAHSSAQALLELINQVLDISKIEAGRMELERAPFDLHVCVESVLALIGPQAREKGLRVSCQFDTDHPLELVGDASRLRQILLNLVGNAVKFTHTGEVAVRVTQARDGRQGIKLRFEVSDTGIGIEKATQAMLFQPFTQADGTMTRRFGGTGLGLSIARELVALMAGEIGVASKPAAGSIFWFTARFEASASAKSTTATVPPTVSRAASDEPISQRLAGRVLIVEDNPVNLEVVTAMLDHLCIAHCPARDGNEAVAVARSGEFDVVLMDCQMPGMDGYDATRALRQNGIRDRRDRPVPIVALTANAFDDDRRRCLEAGMDGFLAKPITLAALRKELARWLTPTARAA